MQWFVSVPTSGCTYIRSPSLQETIAITHYSHRGLMLAGPVPWDQTRAYVCMCTAYCMGTNLDY